MKMTLVRLISEGKLYWWLPLVYFVIALIAGIHLANWIYRDVSWHHLLTSKTTRHWTTKGEMWVNGFDRDLVTIVIMTIVVWVILTCCTILYVGGFQ